MFKLSMAAATMLQSRFLHTDAVGPSSYRRAYCRTTRHATNGKRERERRMRQIARGSLRAENGLIA